MALPNNPTPAELVKAVKELEQGGGGSTIDNQLSTTSENPVQNKVITNTLNDYLPLVDGRTYKAFAIEEDYWASLTIVNFVNCSKYDSLSVGDHILVFHKFGNENGLYQNLSNFEITQVGDSSYTGTSTNLYSSGNKAFRTLYVAKWGNEDVEGEKTFKATLKAQTILPRATNTYDLGSTTFQWNSIYANVIYQNGKQVANAENVPTQLSELADDSTHRLVTDTEKSTWNGKQNALTFDDTPSASSSNPVKSSGIYNAINDVAEIAEGKTQNYVISYSGSGSANATFNSTNDTIAIATSLNVVDVQGNTIALTSLRIGDIISITETSVPDRWVGAITSSTITFYKLETRLNIDSTPTSGSTNPVSSGGVYDAIPKSVDGLSGGQLTSPITLNGGDSATASKMILGTTGQITDTGTATLFGRSNATTLLVGHSSHALTLRGSATRPTYNGSTLAKSSDLGTQATYSLSGTTLTITTL